MPKDCIFFNDCVSVVVWVWVGWGVNFGRNIADSFVVYLSKQKVYIFNRSREGWGFLIPRKISMLHAIHGVETTTISPMATTTVDEKEHFYLIIKA